MGMKTPRTAIRWLSLINGPEAVQGVLAALDDPSASVRQSAAAALRELNAVAAVPALCERLVSDLQAEERGLYAEALGSIGDVRALEPLRQALVDPSEWVAWQACEALGQMRDPRAGELLLGALDHPVERVRETARDALVEQKVDDPRVVATLEAAVRDHEQRGDYFVGAALRRRLVNLKPEAPTGRSRG